MRSLRYTVKAFPSAADFLAFTRLDETACLIADVQMPDMTGIELYEHLIDAGYTIPTILITGYPNDDVRTRVMREGVVCYLPKPLKENDLLQCLRSILDRGAETEGNSS